MLHSLVLRCGEGFDWLCEADGVRNCRQSVELNTSSILELDIRPDCPKYWYFEQPNMLAEAGGRVYCLFGDDAIETSREAGGVDCHVVLKEIWYKLGKKYLTAYNCDMDSEEREFDHFDTHMVVLLGASVHPLYVNGVRLTCPYPVGSAQYMFWVVLQGTGWELDPAYSAYWPDGTFDLETDKKSVLENIETLQGLFGGMLLWNSAAKLVALVDEEKYRPASGFAVRYAHNLKGITRSVSRDIVNRLYPYGNDDLNIAAVNGGREFIEDYGYTTEAFEGIAKHSDIYNQDSLLAWARREMKKLARPRYTYTVQFLDYAAAGHPEAAGYATAEIGGMAVVEDAELLGEPVTQRVTGIDRDMFQPLDCEITVGDILGNWPTTIKDLVVAGDTVVNNITNNNTISGRKISGSSPALDRAEWQWGVNLNETAQGIYSHVEKTYETIENATHTYGVLSTTITQTAEEIRLEAAHTYETKTSASTTYAELRSSITITASEIRSEVSRTYETKTDAGTKYTSLQSSITQTAATIRQEVSRQFTDTNGEVSRAWSAINQTSSRVAVLVAENGSVNASVIISSINNEGSVRINASKINLSGYVTVSSLANGNTTIDGACIQTGYISAARISTAFTSSFNIECGNLHIHGTFRFSNRQIYISGNTLRVS